MNTRTTEPVGVEPAGPCLDHHPRPVRTPLTMPRVSIGTAARIDYAWVILGVAMMGMFMSGPGQSYSVAAFIDPMLADLGLFRSQYSLAYLVATLISGASLPFVGRALDRLGARVLLPSIAAMLGLACLGMSQVRHLVGLYLGLTCVRSLGQGALTLVATWMVGQWFVHRRGTAMGLLGLGSTLSFMVFPAGNLWLIEGYGWRGAWSALAVAVWVLLGVPAILLVRNRPVDHDLESDHRPSKSDKDATKAPMASPIAHSWTARQAFRTIAFWKIVSVLATGGLVVTGLVFHQVSILAARGVSHEAALGLLGVQAFFACGMSLLGGYLADRIPPRYLLAASMVFMAMAIALLLVVRSPMAALPYSILLGMHAGILRCAGSLTLINFFGPLHFGSVNGIAMSLVIGAASLGPLPLALAKDLLGHYEPALLLLLVFPIASALAVWSAHPPGDPGSCASSSV